MKYVNCFFSSLAFESDEDRETSCYKPINLSFFLLILLSAKEIRSKCSKFKWNHEPKSFEHFDDISMVDKSIDHEKLLPICFLQKHCPFFTSISVRVSRKEREKQIAPPSRHFSSTKTLHQSAHEESLSYCKKGFEGISLYIHCITIFFYFNEESSSCSNG